MITSIADSACGYAALTLMPAGSDVLSVEFKVNLLAPARGERFRADAQVVRAGRTLTVCQAEVVAVTAGQPDVSGRAHAGDDDRRPQPAGSADGLACAGTPPTITGGAARRPASRTGPGTSGGR